MSHDNRMSEYCLYSAISSRVFVKFLSPRPVSPGDVCKAEPKRARAVQPRSDNARQQNQLMHRPQEQHTQQEHATETR